MKFKRFMAVLLVLILAFSLCACKKPAGGTPEDNPVAEESEKEDTDTNTYIFGFSGITMENPYYTTLEASIREDIEADGSTLITKDPQGDASRQIQQIREMISDGIQAIFLCPVDWEMISPVIKELKEADIKIINLDTQVQDLNEVDAYVGSDNYKAGEICGKKLMETNPDGGKIVILESTAQNSVNSRITGFEETIAGEGFEVVARADASGNKEKAKSEMARILKEQPAITAVMCGNDQMALGALEAAEEAERTDLRIYGVDGSPDLKKKLKEQDTLIAGSAAQSPINIGKAAAKTGLQIMNGEDYEEETLEDVLFIDKSNVDMYGVDGWQ